MGYAFRRVLLFLFLLPFCCCPPAFGAAGAHIFHPGTVSLGQPFMIEIVSDEEPRGAIATWFGKSAPMQFSRSGNGYFARLLLGSYMKTIKPGTYPLDVKMARSDGIVRKRVLITIAPKKYEEDRLSLPEFMVTPPTKMYKRILQEQRMMKHIRETVSPFGFWSLPIRRPVSGAVSSTYGRRRILNGIPKSPHAGIDFRAAMGTPVIAALAGRVVATKDLYYSGLTVCVDSGQGILSYYFHLSECNVREGQLVEQGSVLAKSGMSGRSTGPHLHFGLSLLGHYVDAESLFDASPSEMLKNTKMVSIDE